MARRRKKLQLIKQKIFSSIWEHLLELTENEAKTRVVILNKKIIRDEIFDIGQISILLLYKNKIELKSPILICWNFSLRRGVPTLNTTEAVLGITIFDIISLPSIPCVKVKVARYIEEISKEEFKQIKCENDFIRLLLDKAQSILLRAIDNFIEYALNYRQKIIYLSSLLRYGKIGTNFSLSIYSLNFNIEIKALKAICVIRSISCNLIIPLSISIKELEGSKEFVEVEVLSCLVDTPFSPFPIWKEPTAAYVYRVKDKRVVIPLDMSNPTIFGLQVINALSSIVQPILRKVENEKRLLNESIANKEVIQIYSCLYAFLTILNFLLRQKGFEYILKEETETNMIPSGGKKPYAYPFFSDEEGNLFIGVEKIFTFNAYRLDGEKRKLRLKVKIIASKVKKKWYDALFNVKIYNESDLIASLSLSQNDAIAAFEDKYLMKKHLLVFAQQLKKKLYL